MFHFSKNVLRFACPIFPSFYWHRVPVVGTPITSHVFVRCTTISNSQPGKMKLSFKEIPQRGNAEREKKQWKLSSKLYNCSKWLGEHFLVINENFSQNHYAEVYTGCVRKMYTHFENRNTKTKSLILNDSEQTSLVVFGHIKK